MIGDQISREDIGHITGTRVLPVRNGMPVVEVTFQSSGEIYGIHVTDMGTYESVVLPDGSLTGRGQGVTTTSDGDTATWEGQGRGRMTNDGKTSWRGSIFYHTTSQRLARLNDIVGMFEFEMDENGKSSTSVWEWK